MAFWLDAQAPVKIAGKKHDTGFVRRRKVRGQFLVERILFGASLTVI
jgi:hypothetical protein